MKSPERVPFYVGYLAIPAALKGFYRGITGLVIVLAVALAAWISLGQQSSGLGLWDLSEQRTLHGVLQVTPYPVLHLSGGERGSVLLVLQGKHEAGEISRQYQGQHVAINGFAIRRGGWSMLEVVGDDSITPLPTPAPAGIMPTTVALGPVTLKGEVVDSKCFLGVMNPGAGKVHKECAELCLLGAIPPMLAAQDQTGRRVGYLLTSADGGSVSRQMAAITGDAVTVHGNLIRRGDLFYIQLAKGGVTRLAAASAPARSLETPPARFATR